MKKNKNSSISKDLQKLLEIFPRVVKEHRTKAIERQRFVEKIFGELARKVHRQVHKETQ